MWRRGQVSDPHRCYGNTLAQSLELHHSRIATHLEVPKSIERRRRNTTTFGPQMTLSVLFPAVRTHRREFNILQNRQCTYREPNCGGLGAANVNSGFAEKDSLSRAPGSSPKFQSATKCDFLMPAEHQS